MAQAYFHKPNSCGVFKVCHKAPQGEKFFNLILDSIEEIPMPLKANAIYFVRDGLAFDIYEVNALGTQLIRRPFLTQNIIVVDLEEGEIVTHNLQTQKLEVTFFDSNNRQVKEMDFEPISETQIKVYLPFGDGIVTPKFTGDIYLKRRE